MKQATEECLKQCNSRKVKLLSTGTAAGPMLTLRAGVHAAAAPLPVMSAGQPAQTRSTPSAAAAAPGHAQQQPPGQHEVQHTAIKQGNLIPAM